MSFHFRCPNGQLLQAENQDIGQVVNCPVCGTAMAIPPNPAGPPVAMPVSPAAPIAPVATTHYNPAASEPIPEAIYEDQIVEDFPDVTEDSELATDEFNVDTGGGGHHEAEAIP